MNKGICQPFYRVDLRLFIHGSCWRASQSDESDGLLQQLHSQFLVALATKSEVYLYHTIYEVFNADTLFLYYNPHVASHES